MILRSKLRNRFLAAGFLLGAQGAEVTPILLKISELGITLLLFTIGLKLRVSTLLRPQVWAVTGLHTLLVVCLFGFGIYGLALLGAPLFAGMDLERAWLLAFALSFSSTVFAVKVFEARGEMGAIHGRVAIGL